MHLKGYAIRGQTLGKEHVLYVTFIRKLKLYFFKLSPLKRIIGADTHVEGEFHITEIYLYCTNFLQSIDLA